MYFSEHPFSKRSVVALSGALFLGIASIIAIQSHQSPISIKAPPAVPVIKNVIMPLLFEKNAGQTSNQVRYLSRSDGYMMFFTSKEIVLDLRKDPANPKELGKFHNLKPTIIPSNDVLRLQFIGANSHPEIVGKDEVTTKTNYFIGNDPKKWQKNVPNFAKVDYKNLYPGIDMVFYGDHQKLEYDIRVSPGADPNMARFAVTGAKDVKLNQNGDLTLTAKEGSKITMQKPIIYQTINGARHPVKGSFVIADKNQIGFKIGAYDKTQTLVIDPKLVNVTFSTYLGGSGGDNASLAVALNHLDQDPQVYMTGYTNSADFPTVGPFQATNNGKGRNAFVSKFSADGSTLIYSTYLGGSGGNDEGFAIAVDSTQNAYITGETNSKDFPTKNPFQATNNGAKDFAAFVTKLNPEGNDLVYSTYLGGSGENQEGNGIAVDIQGFAYVTGETTSTDFPLKNAFQATNKGPKFTAYVTKLNTVGNDLVFSTYLGGSGGQDEGNAIAVDRFQNIYITGETNSKDFPTKDPLQATPKPAGAAQTGFVTKMSANGATLEYSTYLGGSGGNDYPNGIAVDTALNAYVGGYTNSSDFPTVNAVQSTNNGPNFTGFVSKINSIGSALVFSTYLGGSGGNDRVNAVAVTADGRVHVAGFTNSTDFPLKNAVQTTNKGPNITSFATAYNFDGTLFNSTYWGGSGGNDRAYGIALNAVDDAIIVGLTNSADFPLVSPFQSSMTSAIMAFAYHISI